MNCEEALNIIDFCLDGEDELYNKDEFFKHLESCEKCKRAYESALEIKMALENVEYEPLPEGFHDELITKLADSASKRAKTVYAKYAAFAACAVIVFAGSTFLTGSIIPDMNFMYKNNYSNQTASEAAVGIDTASMDTQAESAEVGINLASGSSQADSAASVESVAPTLEGAAVSESVKDDSGVQEYSMKSATPENELYSGNSAGYAYENTEKLIKTGYMSIYVSGYDEALNSIEDYVQKNEGYIENGYSDVYYDDDSGRKIKSGSVTVRIESVKYDGLREFARTLGEVTSESESVQDIQSQYVDTESRLKVKEEERERLTEIMNEAGSIDDIISIESRLSAVIEEIELMRSKLNSYDSSVSYSTLNINISEKDPLQYNSNDNNFTSVVGYNLKNSATGFLEFLKSALIYISGFWVPAVITVVIMAAIVVVYRKRKNK